VFGLLTGLFDGLGDHQAAGRAAVHGLVSGILFGVGMTIFVSLVNGRSTSGPRTWPSARPQVEVTVPGELPAVRALLHAALRALPASFSSRSESRLRAKTGMTWRSFGEVVTADLARSSGGTRIRLSSRPRWPITVVDYGNGRSHLQALLDALDAEFPPA
jgi:hypothetical protein